MFSIVVTREELNIYLDAFMSFCPKERLDGRESLIELVEASDSLEEAIASWLWWCGKGLESALRVKIWFGLSYRHLEEVFALDFRELKKLLRSQRAELLGPYPPLGAKEAIEIPKGGSGEPTSCFMVEQNLSAWIDSEWEDFSQLEKIRIHIDDCESCRDRLTKYRQLQSHIMKERKVSEIISETEWASVLSAARHLSRRRLLKIGLIFLVLVALLGAGGFLMTKKEEKMPNIYEWKPE